MEEKPQRNKKTAKCGHCSGSIPQGEGLKHNSRYYHEDCYEEATKESRHYRELIETICEIFDIDKPTMQMVMQIKRFKDEFNCTYKGMELTLKYFYDILDNSPRDGDGVGIIPWMYEEATRQYVQQMKINESAHDPENHQKVEHVVYIDPNKKRKQNLIDIESL